MRSGQVQAQAERARALLVAHVSPEQRREYDETGALTVIRRGVVWPLLARHACVLAVAVIAAVVAAALSPVGGAYGRVLVALALLPFLSPSSRIAWSRLRRWRIDPDTGPRLLVRGRWTRFCVRIDAPLPSADRVLAFKNVLEANEAYFLRKANVLA